jgi:hypothetical protein
MTCPEHELINAARRSGPRRRRNDIHSAGSCGRRWLVRGGREALGTPINTCDDPLLPLLQALETNTARLPSEALRKLLHVAASEVVGRSRVAINTTEVDALVRSVIVHLGLPFAVLSVVESPAVEHRGPRGTGGVVRFTVLGGRPLAMLRDSEEAGSGARKEFVKKASNVYFTARLFSRP